MNTLIIIRFYHRLTEWVKDDLRIKDGIKVPEGFVYSSDNNQNG